MLTKFRMTAIALAMAASVPAFAQEGIYFDADGSDASFGTQPVNSFDWGGANILARNCIPTPQGVADACTIYIQAALSALLHPTSGSVPFDSAGHEYTLSIRVQADSGSAGAPGTPGDVGTGVAFFDKNQVDVLNNQTGAAGSDSKADLFGDATAFFKIFYDDRTSSGDGSLPSNEVTGLGYDDGKLILEGFVGIVDFGVIVSKALSTPPTPLDSATSSNPINTNQAGVETLTTVGSGNFVINVVPGFHTIDTAFFKDPFTTNATLLRIDIDDNGRGSSPFTATEPSPLVGGFAPNYGAVGGGAFPRVNDFDCDGAGKGVTCDLHLEGDPKSVFKHTIVLPEPSTVALLGLGLGFLGFRARKRSIRPA